MSKHTPGPWEVERSEGGYEQAWVKGSKRIIVTVHGRTRTSNVFTRLNDEDLANARLIAAAPEMLEALKLIRKRQFLVERTADAVHLPADVAAAVEAAIVKAEGKE